MLIDLKIGELSHQDLGQMQMYVNYYDRYVRQEFESPTIGILLCENKNDALVELTLPKDAQHLRFRISTIPSRQSAIAGESQRVDC